LRAPTRTRRRVIEPELSGGVSVGVDYGFGKRFAVGLAYDKVGMGVEASKPGKLNGSLDWGYDGWLLYFKVDFGVGVSKR